MDAEEGARDPSQTRCFIYFILATFFIGSPSQALFTRPAYDSGDVAALPFE